MNQAWTFGIIAAFGLWWWKMGSGGTPDYSQGITIGNARAPGGPTAAEIRTTISTSPGPEIFYGATPRQVEAFTPQRKPNGWSDLDWYDFTHGY